MKMLHEGPGCHRGVHKLTALFQERFWMPSARPDGEGLRDQDRSLGPYRSPPSLANPLHERDGLKYMLLLLMTIAKVKLQSVIGPFGLPEVVLSGRGREFKGKLWWELSRMVGYQLQPTIPYHPQINGLCERAHHAINNAL